MFSEAYTEYLLHLANNSLSLTLAIWKTYRVGIWDQWDNHREVCLRDQRQVQCADYRLKSSMVYKGVHVQIIGGRNRVRLANNEQPQTTVKYVSANIAHR